MFLENIPWPVWIESIDSKIIFLNKNYESIYNVKLQDVIGKTNLEAFPKETAQIYDKQIQMCLQRESIHIVEGKIENSIVECYIFPIKDENNKVQGVAGVIIDVSNTKEKQIEIEKQKNILRTIIDAVPEAIFYKDEESRFIGYNKNFENYYNKRGVTEILGKTDLDIYGNKEVALNFLKQDRGIMKSKEARYFEYSVKDNLGNERIEENVKIPVIDDSGNCWGVVGMSRDITERKNIEERLRYLSEIDILTGLYNRYSFEEKIKELNHEKYHPLGIIMGDVNGLKIVNDTFGHLEGDQLLKDMSDVLKKVCDGKGYVFRWGGDEFIILIPNCNEIQCEETIENIIYECNQSTYKYVRLSIALGEAVKLDLKEDIYECIKKVEDKLYRQKLLEKKSIKSSILESLKKSLEEKNMETNEHTERVVKYALVVGRCLKFKMSDLDELTLVAKLHDIGKIGISEDILLKPGRLTLEEFEIMKTHTEKGYRIINASSELGNVAKCVLTHHERWDGKGYPLGLKGEEIPIISRIISIVDAYDVMTTDRVYKKAMTKKEAIYELNRCSGTQFDPYITKNFIKYIRELA
ncbi:diguanylate cyclase [Romboutsia weinsteinii]|uniref:Diguanylate cyclase n=2 Tax=Romboutsia weinsteinii TaxID=2020949 RepID=A0A371IYN2_9FIRM|nr:diguanylate cyclase [Romboutsia weinsteinii]